MPLKGSIYLTTDYNIVLGNAITHNIVCISGEQQQYQNIFSGIKYNDASVLLPPYEALGAEVDGEMELFKQIYFDYLSKQVPNELIAILLRAIYNGKNILIYLTPSEYEMAYIKFFSLFLQMYFGITIGNGNVPYLFNEGYYPTILTTLYMNNLMSPEEYIKEYPLPFNPNVDSYPLIKLTEDIVPYGVQDIFSAANYFNNYKQECVNSNKELSIPVRGVGK